MRSLVEHSIHPLNLDGFVCGVGGCGWGVGVGGGGVCVCLNWAEYKIGLNHTRRSDESNNSCSYMYCDLTDMIDRYSRCRQAHD